MTQVTAQHFEGSVEVCNRMTARTKNFFESTRHPEHVMNRWGVMFVPGEHPDTDMAWFMYDDGYRPHAWNDHFTAERSDIEDEMHEAGYTRNYKVKDCPWSKPKGARQCQAA